jgi:N utilization substance protein B
MQARRASRELAFLLLSQLKDVPQTDNFEEMILKSVRILTSSAQDELKIAVSELLQMKDAIDTYEADQEINLKRPIGTSNLSVPLTKDVSGKLGEMIDITEKTLAALEIAELAALETQSEVKDYTLQIVREFSKNAAQIDEIIQNNANNWNIERLVKMDRDILRSAITELLYTKGAPMKVVVDEALELAKKYSTDDSASFINGILAKVIVDYGI